MGTDAPQTTSTAPAGDETPAGNPPTRPATPPWLLRIGLGAAGLGLVAGFFLPWVRVGQLVTINGLGLAVTGGDVADQMSGPHRGLILVVPVAGIALLVGAVRGSRGLAWGGLLSGFLIFAVGLYTLVLLFLESTGAGMWMVAASAVGASAIGLAHFRRGA